MQVPPRMIRMRSILFLGMAVVIGVACGDAGSGDATSGDRDPATPGDGGGADGDPAADGGSSSGGDGGADDDDEPAVPYQHFDINHVISTGQSNSVAHEGRPVLSTTQPYGNLMFDVGVMTSGNCEGEGCRTYQKPSSFVPLVEGDTFWWPVETMSAGLANQVTKLATEVHKKPSHDVLVSLHGRNGLTYWCLRKGSCNFVDPSYLVAYDEGMMQVEDGKRLADAAGKSYVVRAVTVIHGESDDYAYATNTQQFPNDGTDGSPQSITSYADGLLEWQRDYEAGIKAITGQTVPVPLLISQFSGWNNIPHSAVTQFQYEAHVRSEGKVVLVAPAYILEWHADCRHYTNHGERQLGEYFAKVYSRIVIEGRRWEPVRPRQITIAGSVVTARFHVPVPPLVLDTDRVTDPGQYGFEVVNEAGANLPIDSVALDGPDTVKITLANPPNGKARLRYAFTGVPNTCPGRFVGPRGNLRDSDATPSQAGYELFNWGVHFEAPIE
jgi:hypothetical protein